MPQIWTEHISSSSTAIYPCIRLNENIKTLLHISIQSWNSLCFAFVRNKHSNYFPSQYFCMEQKKLPQQPRYLCVEHKLRFNSGWYRYNAELEQIDVVHFLDRKKNDTNLIQFVILVCRLNNAMEPQRILKNCLRTTVFLPTFPTNLISFLTERNFRAIQTKETCDLVSHTSEPVFWAISKCHINEWKDD